jgi:hypothetical protein
MTSWPIERKKSPHAEGEVETDIVVPA